MLGAVPVPLPEIHLTDLGKGSDGLTPSDLAGKVLQTVLTRAISAAAEAGKSLGTGVSKEAGKQVEKVTKGIGTLFK